MFTREKLFTYQMVVQIKEHLAILYRRTRNQRALGKSSSHRALAALGRVSPAHSGIMSIQVIKHGTYILGDPEVTAYIIYCKSRNLPNTDTQNYRTDMQ